MSNDTYQREKAFFEVYSRTITSRKLGFESTALRTLEEFEKESMAKARKSLTLGLNDALEDTEDWPLELVQKFDEALVSYGAATLSELRVKRSSKYKRILKRGTIKTETEYYLIKGIVDSAQEHIPADDVPVLDAMLAEYERSVVARRKAD